jgi:hypothetical protein
MRLRPTTDEQFCEASDTRSRRLPILSTIRKTARGTQLGSERSRWRRPCDLMRMSGGTR